MKSNELLFELIHSLTKSEKRYFKVFATMHGNENNYVELFDAIHKQKQYNEKALKEEFKNRDFAKQFSVAKNYLLNLILKSLRTYHHKSKISIEINDFLSEVEILYWKGLYKLANKRLQQAKKLAEKYDLQLYLLQINYWEGKLQEYLSVKMEEEDKIDLTRFLTEETNSLMELEMMVKKMMKYTRRTLKGTPEVRKVVQEILAHPLLSVEYETATSNFYILNKIYILKGIGYSLLLNSEKEYEYKLKQIKLLEANPHQIEEDPLKYTSALNNMLLYYYFHGKGNEAKDLLRKLNGIDLRFPHAKHIVEKNRFTFNLMYNLAGDDFEAIRLQVESAEQWYPQLQDKMPKQDRMIFEYNLAMVYYILEDYKKSLRWANSMLNYSYKQNRLLRHDLVVSTLIITSLIYIELGYEELARKNIKQMEDIARINKYDKLEKEVIKSFNLLLTRKPEDEAKAWEVFKLLANNEQQSLSNIDKDIFIYSLKKQK